MLSRDSNLFFMNQGNMISHINLGWLRYPFDHMIMYGSK